MPRTSRSANSSSGIQSVERALNILELLSKTQTPLGVIEISDALGINRTTVYGLLNTLIKKDYVLRSDINSKYVISGKMYNISYSYPNRLPVVRYASSYMLELANRFNATVHLGTFSIRNDVLLVKAQFPRNIQNIRSGSLFPVHASGLGKVILAYLPENTRESVLASCDMRAYTRRTITDKEVLRRELKQIRSQGYGRDLEEYLEGTTCVAFPIFNDKNEIAAAMSISGAPDHIDPQLELIISEGLRCSKQCSIDMGWDFYNY